MATECNDGYFCLLCGQPFCDDDCPSLTMQEYPYDWPEIDPLGPPLDWWGPEDGPTPLTIII